MEFLFVVLIFVVILAICSMNIKSADEPWRQAAMRLKMDFRPGSLFLGPKLTGRISDFLVKADTKRRNTGISKKLFTRYQVKYPSLGLGLEIKAQGLFSGIFGAPSILTGDQDFDELVSVKADHEEGAKAFLIEPRRALIKQFMLYCDYGVITDTTLTGEIKGKVKSHKRLITTMEKFCQMAQVLIGADARDPVLVKPVDITPVKEEKPVAPPADLEQLSHDLFKGNLMSMEATALFEEKYKGQTVTWEGELLRVNVYYSDMVFGDGPGARVCFMVHPPSGVKEIQAIGGFDGDTGKSLMKSKGEQFVFMGELLSCDPFLRKIFLKDCVFPRKN